MRIGVALSLIHPSLWAEVTCSAEDLGFESVWLSEHLVFPLEMGSPYPGGNTPVSPATPLYDAPAYLSYLAGLTDHVLLGTNIYLAALRHPFVVARAFATLDHVSHGRAALGVGAGWLESEVRSVGIDPSTRGARLDETIDIVRRLWTEDVIEHHGEFFDFDAVRFEPKPVQQPRLPIIVGGEARPALRRAAVRGDGWMGMPSDPATAAPLLGRLGEECARAERAEPLEITMTDLEARSLAELAQWEDLGVDRLIVRPWTRSSEALAGLQRFASEVLGPWSERP